MSKVQKVLAQPINLIFRFLQSRTPVLIWLYGNTSIRIQGTIIGFDEYMNLVLDNAEEIKQDASKERTELGRIMLKGDSISVLQTAEVTQ